jgi:hypothetical protein
MLPKSSEEVLAKERERRNDPNWLPRMYLNGGAAFSIQIEEKMRPLWKKEKDQIVRW